MASLLSGAVDPSVARGDGNDRRERGRSRLRVSRAWFISLPASLAASLPATIHDRFMGVWWAHCASYLVGLVGAGVLCFHIWKARGRPPVISVFPRTRGACLRAAVLAAAVGCILWFRLTAR